IEGRAGVGSDTAHDYPLTRSRAEQQQIEHLAGTRDRARDGLDLDVGFEAAAQSIKRADRCGAQSLGQMNDDFPLHSPAQTAWSLAHEISDLASENLTTSPGLAVQQTAHVDRPPSAGSAGSVESIG